MVFWRRGERYEWQTAENSDDTGGFADVAGDVVGCQRRERKGLEGEVQERRIRVFGIPLPRLETRIGRITQILLALGNDAQEPRFTHPGIAAAAVGEVVQDVREENGDGLLGRGAGEGLGDVVAPELEAHRANGRGGDGVGYAVGFDVEGADGDMGGLGGGAEEGLESVGGGVIFSVEI